MKAFFSTAEKTFLRVGAVLAVVSTILLLRSEFFRPSPPDLKSVFLLSRTDELNYAQQLSEPDQQFSEDFPIGLIISNAGGTVAKDVILYLFPEHTMEMKIMGIPSEIRNVVADDGFRQLHRLTLGDINPGENIPFDENIWCRVFNLNRLKVQAVHKDKTKKDVPISRLHITYDLEARLSAENAPLKTIHLYLTTGIEDQFLPKGVPYYTYTNGKISYHKNGT